MQVQDRVLSQLPGPAGPAVAGTSKEPSRDPMATLLGRNHGAQVHHSSSSGSLKGRDDMA